MANCNNCGQVVFWQRGRKSGKLYLTNSSDNRADFHSNTCSGRQPREMQPAPSPQDVTMRIISAVQTVNAPVAAKPKAAKLVVTGAKLGQTPSEYSQIFKNLLAKTEQAKQVETKAQEEAFQETLLVDQELAASLQYKNNLAAGYLASNVPNQEPDQETFVTLIDESEGTREVSKLVPVDQNIIAELYLMANSEDAQTRLEAQQRLIAMFNPQFSNSSQDAPSKEFKNEVPTFARVPELLTSLRS